MPENTPKTTQEPRRAKPTYATPLGRKEAGERLIRAMLRRLAEARKNISRAIIEKAHEQGVFTSARAREELFNEIKKVYATLDAEFTGAMKTHYRHTAESADEQLKKDLKLKGAKNRDLTRFSAERMTRYFEMVNPANAQRLAGVATQNMATNTINKLRSAFVETYRRGAIEGLTTAELHREIGKAWDKTAGDRNAFRFVDKSGRAWSNERYLQMLVTTSSERIWRESYMDTCAEAGVDLMMISTGWTDCEVCGRWTGRIISMTGATKGFPTYEDALSDGMFHPNCTHRLEAVDEELDADIINRGDIDGSNHRESNQRN